ncbi:hypothetical protein [Dokdonella sp.]|uniref:hypothetical protein n=1 Tax=Dokdonella sp. TaxID=2291710 RepID=UPI0037846A13
MLRPLLAAIAMGIAAAHPLHAAAPSTRAYVDAYEYFTTDAQFEAWYSIRAALEDGFDDICGDTFCEGDWSNITPLRLRCSVQLGSGRIGRCVWSFAASNEEIDARSGAITVDTQAWRCVLPVAPRTTIAELLAALAGDDPLYTPLPRTTLSVYDALSYCL